MKLIAETAGLLEPGIQAPMAITKVTIVLPPVPESKILEAEGRIVPEDDTPALEANYRVLPDADEAE